MKRRVSSKQYKPLQYKLPNGVALVGSDAHFWPGQRSTAFRAFLAIAKREKPQLVIMNGDVIDGASISRHSRIGWENQPTVKQELDVAQERLKEIKKVTPESDHFWTLGNHDARFELRLAEVASEFADVPGIHLRDHFPDWRPAWAIDVNGDTIIKHRYKGGVHAAYNNAKDSGRNIITGHLHALNVSAYTDYNGTRWGVDGGTLAAIAGPQFYNYTEQNPLNWRSGFVRLRFEDGKLMWPDVLYVVDERKGIVNYRGGSFSV